MLLHKQRRNKDLRKKKKWGNLLPACLPWKKLLKKKIAFRENENENETQNENSGLQANRKVIRERISKSKTIKL